ncbi:MAG: hypothetical protein AB9897_04305 [Anaerolineaceae bacterium]
MTNKQRQVFWVLIAFSLSIVLLYIFPDLQGAVNSEMLSVFQPDEYAQYPYVIHMLRGGTVIQTIHSFLVYGHYYYGYPFYFFSGLALIPVKLILGANWTASTPIIMTVLRETQNVIPMLIAMLLLVWMTTQFRSVWKSVLLFVFLESLPVVVANNQWWHPDSWLVLFCVLTLFFLQRDKLRFGKNFFFSAIAVGLATSTKMLGVLFITSYIVYLSYGLITKKISLGKAFIKAALFLLIMAATILLGTPQLLMPQERLELIAVFKDNFLQNTRGFWVTSGGVSQNWRTFSEFMQNGYSGWIMVSASLFILIVGIAKKETRLYSFLLFSWVFTYCGYFIFIAATLRPHYFIPVILPLFAAIAQFWPERIELNRKVQNVEDRVSQPFYWVSIASVLLILVFSIINCFDLQKSVHQTLREEVNSPSIQFFTRVDQKYLIRLPIDKNFTIYRDWRAYVAPQTNWNVTMNWDLADYSKINELKPAILFLETENINYFSDPSKLSIALDETGMKLKNQFYLDAKNDGIQGYVLLDKSDFGKAFARQDIYDTYLATPK